MCIRDRYQRRVRGYQESAMGRVRTRTTKRSAKIIVEKYYQRLTLDFQTNKKICDEVASIQSKRLRNKIAGFLTHLMKRISRGPVRGISLKLQEEERERRLDYIPDISAVDLEIEKGIEIDQDTKNMLRAMDMGNMPGLNVVSQKERNQYRPRYNRDN
eukprot:TRINITY_DN174_c0_g1_i5.p1 TRINITY_DN174_c0_g1~~TRINITY_DN174_c0_g1_i5.p1  ORF type:complete len:158 (+),score=49.14 TRINITY_DN174_c0_g1_i5:140-613(+)